MNDLEDDEIVLRVEKDPLIGKELAGRYEIVSVLGRGGMGVVYKARQKDIDRIVAVKTLHMSGVMDSRLIQRFRSEAQAVSKVRHPNTVVLYDFGVSSEGVPFLVMEMLDGKSFRDIVKANAPLLNLGRVNRVFQQICAALGYAHENGIVHKDLKPENVMICQRSGQTDWVYVLDFGIAGMMEAPEKDRHEIVGSPPYMSPEQCSGKAGVDQRSDIYSLGVCLFEALSGKFPFQARTAMEMLDCHISAKPLLLKELDTKFSTYESLTQMILKSMEKKPENRQQSAAEFAAELEEALKKDSKRGMQLKDRVTLEVSSALSSNDEPAEDEIESKGRKDSDEDTKYYFSNCPHCDAQTQPGLSLCLSCGRSLASKEDFSRIRASKGEFSLPKYQELGADSAQAPPGFSKRSRLVMSGNIWTRPSTYFILSFFLMVAIFVAAGGPQIMMEKLKESRPQAAGP